MKRYIKSSEQNLDAVKNDVFNTIAELLDSEFETDLAQYVASQVPGYDTDYCAEEVTQYSEHRRNQAKIAYINAIVSDLFANA